MHQAGRCPPALQQVQSGKPRDCNIAQSAETARAISIDQELEVRVSIGHCEKLLSVGYAIRDL